MSAVMSNQVPNVCERMCSLDWLRCSTRPTIATRMKQLRIADLFSGAGGMTLGATEAANHHGYRPIISFALDIDHQAIDIYTRNFEAAPGRIVAGDAGALLTGTVGSRPRKAEEQLVSQVGPVDVLLAGPPCQGHSDLNNHTRRNDVRNGLYLRAVRFAELFKPQVVIIENVRSVTLDRNEVVQTSAEHLDGIGYHVQQFILNVSDLGLPQLRKRHVLLAVRHQVPEFETTACLHVPRLSLAISDLVDEYRTAGDDIFRTPSKMSKANVARTEYLFAKDKFDLPNRLRPPCHRDKEHSYVSMYGRLQWDKPAQTITSGFGSPGQGRYIHPLRPRVITPHEAARIQGFPDYFTFDGVDSRVKLQELIGNAVPPILAARVLEHVIIAGGMR